MSKRFYYKVVSTGKDGSLSSYNISLGWRSRQPVYGPLILKYEPGVPTRPVLAGTKLFLFDTAENAKRFAGSSPDKQVWAVQAKNVSAPKYYDRCGYCQGYWEARKRKKRYKWVERAHTGARFADEITLIERVQ